MRCKSTKTYFLIVLSFQLKEDNRRYSLNKEILTASKSNIYNFLLKVKKSIKLPFDIALTQNIIFSRRNNYTAVLTDSQRIKRCFKSQFIFLSTI